MYQHIIDILKESKILNDSNHVSKHSSKIFKKLPYLSELIEQYTSFLTTYTDTKTRLAVVLNNITEQPKCLTCGIDVKTKYFGAPTFCSRNCITKEYVKQKSEETNLQKYGVKNAFQHPDFQAKQKQTVRERYNVDNVRKSDAIKKKIRETTLLNNGVEYPMQSIEIRRRTIQTCLERYGTEFAAQNPIVKQKISDTKNNTSEAVKHEIKERTKQTHRELYENGHSSRSSVVREKYRQTCLERYNTDCTLKVLEIQERQKATRRKKYNVDYYSQKHFSVDIIDKLNNKEWLLEQHRDKKRTLLNIAAELNISDTTIGRYFKKHGIEVTNHDYTSQAERDLIEFIRSKGINVIPNTRSIIPPYELDAYLPDMRIAFEFNGIFWHGESEGKTQFYHKVKTDKCNKKDIQLYHIFENDWKNNRTVIEAEISRHLGMLPVLDLEYNELQEIKNYKRVWNFFETNSLYTPNLNSVFIGTPMCIAECTFVSDICIIRVVISNSVDISSFQCILTYIRDVFDVEMILFVDDVSAPKNKYFSNNQLIQNLLPTCCYFKKHTDYIKLLPVSTFGDNYDWNVLKQAGYDRIWNCGYNVYSV